MMKTIPLRQGNAQPDTVSHPVPARAKQSDLTEYIGATWTLERKAGKVYVTHVGGHTVALNDPAYPSAPQFHVPDYVLRVAKRMVKP